MSMPTVRLALLIALTGTGTGALGAQTAHTPKPLRILFLGNSYTFFNQMPQQIQLLALSGNQPRLPEIHQVTKPGADLRDHWQDSASLRAIRRGGWDYVVLQEQSTAPITRPDSMVKYARLLGEHIRRAGGKPLLFLTWARKSSPSDQAALTATYERAALALGAKVVPVGTAVSLLPRRAPAIEFFHDDGSHPLPAGSYLAACVFYAVLYDRTPVGLPGYIYRTKYNSFSPGDVDVAAERLPASDAETLQRLAWDVVRASPPTSPR